MHHRKAFTLVEMLLVISIIVILISMTLPGLGKARYNARMTECMVNMRSQWMPQTILADDNAGKFWRHNDYSADYLRSGGATNSLWHTINSSKYLPDGRVTICPVIKAEPGPSVAPGGYMTYLDASWNGATYGPYHSDQPQILTTYLWFANYETGDGTNPAGVSTIYLTVNGKLEPTWPKRWTDATSERAMITHRISGGPGYACHDLGHSGVGLAITAGELLLKTREQPVAFGDGHVIARPASQIAPRTLITTGGIGNYYY